MKLLQIDACLNTGSTGRISEDIARTAMQRGWECFHIHGARYVNPPSIMKHYQSGNVADEYFHFAEYLFFDNDGLASRYSTHKILKYICDVNPDVIQLHDIHDHWLNYRILFEYLNTLTIPIVWTQHDCWSFTGDCFHFSQIGCNQWVTRCTKRCPARSGNPFRRIINHTEKHYSLKKKLFLSTKNLTLVPVSNWLEGILRKSFFKEKRIVTIHNGIDLEVFKSKSSGCVRQKFGIGENPYVIGVATAWSDRKGLNDYLNLVHLLNEGILLVLVGIEGKNAEVARNAGIITIPRTENVDELAALYSGAEVVLNLSYEETFGLTSVEGFGCGTPTIVYNCTASPELVGSSIVGVIVEKGDVNGVVDAIHELMSKDRKMLSQNCRLRAEELYDKNKCYNQYVDLYDSLVNNKVI